MLTTKRFKNNSELSEHIKTHAPSFYFSSQTSTVIPYDKLKMHFDESITLCDLSQLPPKMELKDGGLLFISGAVSWKEARTFLNSKGRTLKTYPTEELALVLAGLATSCTGERCFGHGTLRSQVKEVTYLNHQGEEVKLSAQKELTATPLLKEYQKSYEAYHSFKNAPYPRFQYETDLMIGTEGQLGVITSALIETAELSPVTYLFLLLPKWEEDYSKHLEIYQKVQGFRKSIHSVELVDSNAFNYLKPEERVNKDGDVIFLEIVSQDFDEVFENLISTLPIDENAIFEISQNRFHELRASIPRAVFETNSQMGVVKMGTDVQVIGQKNFQLLLDIYRGFQKTTVKYNLFGHFGDAHLHFNFMPSPQDVPACQEKLNQMYKELLRIPCSPFAEHGIGLIKQKFIRDFWQDIQYQTFQELKKQHDPQNQFFPQGFMSLGRK